jgi:hypothetical protein
MTDITGYIGHNVFYNNFNISKLPNFDRPYIDDFFETDIESIRRAKHTTVLNKCQKDYIIKLYPELEEKISINQKVISKQYFDIVGTSTYFHSLFAINEKIIFFPFRLTDPCYKFEETVKKYNDYTIIITDPNCSYSKSYRNVVCIKPNKKDYYGILSNRPTIIYNEDPDVIFHPGLADFIYFDCKIISDYNIPTLDKVLL